MMCACWILCFSSALTSSPLLIKDLVLTPVLLTISLWNIYIGSLCLQLYQSRPTKSVFLYSTTSSGSCPSHGIGEARILRRVLPFIQLRQKTIEQRGRGGVSTRPAVNTMTGQEFLWIKGQKAKIGRRAATSLSTVGRGEPSSRVNEELWLSMLHIYRKICAGDRSATLHLYGSREKSKVTQPRGDEERRLYRAKIILLSFS